MAQPIIPYVNADNVGSTASLLQVLNRELKKSSANIGDGLTLLVINNGEISPSNLNLGSATKFVFLQNGRLQISSSSVGSDTKIIKIANGEFQESTGNVGSDIKFVYLKDGTITPTNRSLGSNSKHIFMNNGALTASDASIGGMVESYFVTSDSVPVEGKQYYKKDSGADTYTEITGELTADTDLSMLGYNVYERPVAECHIICMKDGETVVPNKASIGNEACFLYLENGALKASKINAGQSAKLIEFVNGKLKESSESLGGEGKLLELRDGQLVESDELDIGGEDRLLYVQGGRIVSSHVNIGSDTRALKIVNGQLVEGSVELARADAIGAGGGTGGGVIDGVLCKDADGNDVVTELTKENGGLSSTMTKIEYTVKNDCYLTLSLENVEIEGWGSNVSKDFLDVYVGNNVVAKLTDTYQAQSGDNDNVSTGFPVKSGSVITLTGNGSKLFQALGTDAKFTAKEFRLNSLSVSLGLPNYDKGEDISTNVVRDKVGESNNYKAKNNGFVLFHYHPTYTGSIRNLNAYGYINNVEVYCAACNDNDKGDYDRTVAIIPVSKDNVIDVKFLSGGSETIDSTGFTCTFFPIQGAGESSTGPIEIPIAECAFTTEVGNNPFIANGPIVSPSRLHISANDIKDMTGRDVNLAEATVSVKVDLFYPKYIAGTTVVSLDADGFATKDTTKPMFRDDLIHWSGAFTLEQAYTIGNVSSDAVDIHLQAPQASRFIWLPSTCKISGNDGGIPTVDELYAINTFSNTYSYATTTLIANATSLGLDKYYIRLTAVIDPNRKNVVESKSGMFVTGDIAKDENGNVCKTLVPYTEWAAKQDSNGKYVYEYVVKTDCWLHADYLVNINGTVVDKVTVTINGEVFSTNVDDTDLIGTHVVSHDRNSCSLPLKRGTKVGFHSNKQPNRNLFLDTTDAEYQSEQYAIKITEFKMGTELNPAQFPSLAVRVLDCDMGEVDSNLGKTYTWTESELRQIFGPMYSVDESRIEFSTTFYKATSAEGFDDATIKMTDTRDLLQNTAAYLKFPVTISKNDAGNNIISVYVPTAAEMLTSVSWDPANSKFIMNNGVLELRNSGMPVGIRMRLNMHISDRRGDMPDELLPNGISPNSKMVRQGDMNIAAANALGSVAYTNEITITESGTCIIMSNFDSDSNGVDYTIVAVQALIGGNWTTIQTAPTQTISDGRGVQSFNFPVEAGTKLRIATDAAITGAAGNISGTRSDLDAMFTHAHQALCWVIPTGKYQNPELNLPGSAGVIDGSIWKDENGNEITSEQTCDTTTTKYTYHVKNDCYLYIKLIDTSAAITTPGFVSVRVNDVEAGRLSDINLTQTPYYDNVSVGIPVSEGSVVELVNGLNDADALFRAAGGKISFTEFKLRATNVLAAMPDWDDSKKVAVTDGYIAESDGFLRINVQYGQVSGHYSVLVNDIVVWKHYDGDEDRAHGDAGVIPICRGDKVTISKSAASTQTADIYFYPVKMTRTEHPDKMIVPNWSGDGTTIVSGGSVPSDGWIIVNTTDRMDDGTMTVLVNGISVWRSRDGNNNTKGYTANIPVAKNDIVTVTGSYTTTIKFYPAKPATTTVSEADILEEKINKNAADIAALSTTILGAVYPVGSVYISVSSSLPEPIAAIGTWVQMATGKTLWNVDPSVTTPGTEIDAGLPNITGAFNTRLSDYGVAEGAESSGAVSVSKRYQAWQSDEGGQDNLAVDYSIDASRSSSIYGNSTTVQPPAIAVTMWQRTA